MLAAGLAMPARSEPIYAQIDYCTKDASSAALSSEAFADEPFYDSLVADDFFVPAGSTWTIDMVSPFGSYFSGSGTPVPATSFNVSFYYGSTGAPELVIPTCVYSGRSYSTRYQAELKTYFDIGLGLPCVLPGGTTGASYWVSVQANMAPSTDWGWQERYAQTGSPGHIEYPFGAGGEACRSWSLKTDCVGAFAEAHPDQCFALDGSAPIIFRSGFDG